MGASLTREEEIFVDVIDIIREKVRELESDKNFDRITDEKYQDEGMKIDWEVFCLEYAVQKYYGIG